MVAIIVALASTLVSFLIGFALAVRRNSDNWVSHIKERDVRWATLHACRIEARDREWMNLIAQANKEGRRLDPEKVRPPVVNPW
jgi:hypothetical protein